MPQSNRRIALRTRPDGPVQESNFVEEACPVPEPGDGQLLLENAFLAIDPAIRQWIGGRGRYLAPIGLGDTVRSVVLGRIVQSNLDGFEPGDWVRALGGWEHFSVVGKRDFPFRAAGGDAPAPTTHLGVLGSAGLAAYFGLFAIGKPASSETVVVSSAAGAVGSIVCQLASHKGCRVVGITGSDEKAAWLRENCGVAATVNHREDKLRSALKTACPDGIDVYFDNVGGETLEAVLWRLNRAGRIVLCGATASYDGTPPTGPANYLCLLEQGGRMEGFMASQFLDRFPEAIGFLAEAIADGRLVYREEFTEGLATAPSALVRVLQGNTMGRMMTRL